MAEKDEKNSQLTMADNAVSPARRYLSVSEGASFMGISPWTLRELARKGEIRRIKIGRRILFDRRDLIEFVESRKERQVLGPYRREP